MEPLTTGVPGCFASCGDQLRTDAQVLRRRIDHHILDPRMRLTVPDHVDKPKQVTSVSGGYPAKAVSLKQVSPISLAGSVNPWSKSIAV